MATELIDVGTATPRLLSRRQAARQLGISVGKFDRLLAGGEGPESVRIGSRRLIVAASLDEWIRRAVAGGPHGGRAEA